MGNVYGLDYTQVKNRQSSGLQAKK